MDVKYGSCAILSEIVPESTFWDCYVNLHPILSPCTNLNLIGEETKKLQKNLIFDGTSDKIRDLNMEITS